MNEREAVKRAKELFGSFGTAGRSGRQSTFNLPYVTDGTGRTWHGQTFEEALSKAEADLTTTPAQRVARKAFAARGNPTYIHIAEYELAAIISEAL